MKTDLTPVQLGQLRELTTCVVASAIRVPQWRAIDILMAVPTGGITS